MLGRKRADGRHQSARRLDVASACGFFAGGAHEGRGKEAGGQRGRHTRKDRGGEKFRVLAFSFLVFSQQNHSGSLLDVGPGQNIQIGPKNSSGSTYSGPRRDDRNAAGIGFSWPKIKTVDGTSYRLVGQEPVIRRRMRPSGLINLSTFF